ncbi:MAG: hypothetical protein ACI35O_10790 [Bacillaceae bacterium]
MPDHKVDFQVNLVKSFIRGDYTEEEYIQNRKIYKHSKQWKEAKEVAKYGDIWYLFLLKLKIPNRLRALIVVHDLTRPKLREMANFNKGGGIEALFSTKKKEDRGINKSRIELAILTDTPLEFLLYDKERNNYLIPHQNAFLEYKYLAENIEVKDLIELTHMYPDKRMIQGFCIINDLGIFQSKQEVYVRLDRRLDFFCLQFHLSSSDLVYSLILDLADKWGNQIKHILLGDAFLRRSKVLTFIGVYNNKSIKNEEYYDFIDYYKQVHNAIQITYL